VPRKKATRPELLPGQLNFDFDAKPKDPLQDADHVHWTQLFHRWHGRDLPLDYLTFDLETTGFSTKPGGDLPIDIGWVVVRGGEVVHRGHRLLNWVDYCDMDEMWLDAKLSRIRDAFRDKHQVWPYYIENLREEGESPYVVLDFFLKLLRRNGESKDGLAGAKLVGQNAWSFDVAMLTNVFQEALGQTYDFAENDMYDVGCMEKAILAGDLEPYPGELTLKEYFLRVAKANRPGVHWNADACARRYRLDERYGIDFNKLHTAEADAYVSHLMFEEHRALFAKHAG
jgi:DNA polymerase III epsilon subunit-like protein